MHLSTAAAGALYKGFARNRLHSLIIIIQRKLFSLSRGEFIQESSCPLSQIVVHIYPAVGALNVPESNPRATPTTGNNLIQAIQNLGYLFLFTQSSVLPFASVLPVETATLYPLQAIG
jgi:hypothetical protein